MKLTHYYGNHYTRNKPNSYSLIVKAVIFFLVILHLALGIYLKLWKLTLSIAYTAPITLEAQNTAQMRALRRLVSIMWLGFEKPDIRVKLSFSTAIFKSL